MITRYVHVSFFLFLSVIIPVQIKAQENLVPNPSFENLTVKPKKIGELDKAAPWKSPTQGTAEIFYQGAKNDEISAPKSLLGHQIPRTGGNYAGAIFYDKKNPDLREYLQVELVQELEAGKIYCVEFYVNISDLSKYSIDLIGAHFGKKAIGAANMEPLRVTPQIVNTPGRIIGDQVRWELICGEFVSSGGEKFLTIGSFHNDKQLQIGRMRKPKDVPGQQNDYGYYFIDDVSVIEQNDKYKCDCAKKIDGPGAAKMNIVYSKVSGEEEERLKPEDLVESKTIYFEPGKSEITKGTDDLKLILEILKQNTQLKLEVIGFAETAELSTNAELRSQRAEKVADFLVKNGISPDRISVSKGKTPIKPTDLKKVEFSINMD
jgi:outer membrane protein OmpA-like peptidoglycan-associated protein